MWGDLLWDKQELIERHTDQNIEFVGKCRTFVGHIAQAEIEFAKRLRAIVKESSSSDDDTTSTCGKVWQSVLQSVNKVAEQHEGTSTALLAQVCTPMKQVMKTKAQERQDVLKQIAKLRDAQAKAIANLEKSRKKYEKHEKEAETARVHFEKLEKLESTTKKKEQEARLKWAAKAKEAEAVLRTLEDEADGVNRGRVVFYKQDLPAAYNSLQAIDESRAENLVSNLSEFAKCYKNAMSANIQAMDTVQQTAQGHKKHDDSAGFATANETSTPLPGNLPVLDKKNVKGSPKPSPSVGRKSPKGHRRQQSTGPPPEPEEDDIESAASSPEKPAMPQRQVLYDFAGSNDGELPVAASETIFVAEDDGSGWVLCAKTDGQRGYVPASYLE